MPLKIVPVYIPPANELRSSSAQAGGKEVPCTFKAANEYVRLHHRHNTTVLVARLALAVADEQNNIHGVGIAALPVARALDDGQTLEARRVCTDGYKNACSIIYAALWRAARAIGYTSMITFLLIPPANALRLAPLRQAERKYTLVTEPGSSLKALGWRVEETIKAKSWAQASRNFLTASLSEARTEFVGWRNIYRKRPRQEQAVYSFDKHRWRVRCHDASR